MNKRLLTLLSILFIIAVAILVLLLYLDAQKSEPIVTEQKKTATPSSQTQDQNEDQGNIAEKADLIRVTVPLPNQVVTSPLSVKGEARGSWFFEANFPVKIYNASGKLLGTAVAMTTSDWMTSNFVPFEATLTFEAPTTETGTLILEKDNPSGLPENDDQLEIPIKFNP